MENPRRVINDIRKDGINTSGVFEKVVALLEELLNRIERLEAKSE